MNSWKNTFKCIGFGMVAALVSCSAIGFTKRNIRVQSEQADTSKNAPPVPASMVARSFKLSPSFNYAGYHPQARRQDFRPFKDSLWNAIQSLHNKVDTANKQSKQAVSMLTVGISNQKIYMNMVNGLVGKIDYLNDQVQDLRDDTTRLAANSRISKGVKEDAEIGDTFSKYGFYLLCFIAIGIIIIIILIILVHIKINKNGKAKNLKIIP